MDEAQRRGDSIAITSAAARGAPSSGRSGMTWPPALPFTTALARARAHDAHALSLLYHRFLPVVYRYVLGRVGDIHAAEDVTSETFLAMLNGIASTRADEELSFAAWMLGIARHQAAMHFRRHARSPIRLDASIDISEDVQQAQGTNEGDPLAILTARESWHEVVAALNHLTEEQRTVVLYRCVLDYSADEVGQLLGKQAGAIRVQQFRALASLARLLGAPSERDAHKRHHTFRNRAEGSDSHAAK